MFGLICFQRHWAFSVAASSNQTQLQYLTCSLSGLVNASGISGPGLKFEAGKEYVFDYTGRLMTGIPELANQYSGLGIDATVSVVSK